MRTSNIISFVVMLISGVITLVAGMLMESVLKISGFLMIFAAAIILFSIVNFILGLRSSGKVYGIFNIITLVIVVAMFFYSRTLSNVDANTYPDLLRNHNFAPAMLFITTGLHAIFSIINSILGLSER